jgi:hypothetical protein
MIPQRKHGARAPREQDRLLYLKVFKDIARDLPPSMAHGAEFATQIAAVRSRAASLPGVTWLRDESGGVGNPIRLPASEAEGQAAWTLPSPPATRRRLVSFLVSYMFVYLRSSPSTAGL